MADSSSSLLRRLTTCFLAGLFTILPLIITLAVIGWVAGIINGYVGPESFLGDKISLMGNKLGHDGSAWFSYLAGCVIVLIAIFVLGVVVQSGFRRFLQGLVEPIMKRIPLAGSVYGAASQIVGLLEKRDDSDLQGMSVVYCVFGQEHGSGLLALLPSPDRYPIEGREHYVVYIPTSPIPMTGGLLFMPVESVKPVDMSVESLMSIYLSMGITAPQFMKQKPQINQPS